MSYLCKITTSRAPAASQITFSSSVVFLFPPQNSRKCRCGELVVCSVHAHAQHLMHLRQSDLCVFSFYFPWHFKVRENEIVGGGIGCQIQSLQFYPSHFLPQHSGKCNCRGWGVIFVQNYNISCTCGKSSSVVFLFPPQNSRKCRCGVLVVCSIHAHVQHLMTLRQSDLHVFSLYFPCPTSRFGKTKLWVVVSRL